MISILVAFFKVLNFFCGKVFANAIESGRDLNLNYFLLTHFSFWPPKNKQERMRCDWNTSSLSHVFLHRFLFHQFRTIVTVPTTTLKNYPNFLDRQYCDTTGKNALSKTFVGEFFFVAPTPSWNFAACTLFRIGARNWHIRPFRWKLLSLSREKINIQREIREIERTSERIEYYDG